jgi:serine/threonine-protein kinase
MAAIESETERRGGLARHRILVELGQGGMSNVYLAVARGPADFHKLVVLKVLRSELAQDVAFRDMALSEAKIAARLNHPNVVQTYEVLNEGERPVIVMEYLEGQSLSNVLARVKDGLSLPMRLRVLADALGGLQHAHELCDFDGSHFELVHRDFTPQNIFVGYDGHVKVLDFGIAKTTMVADDDSRTGTLKGKVRYMAPEQIAGTPPIDHRTDIYAAGIVLWELLTGSPPFKEEGEIVIINKIINGELPSVRTLAPDAPEELVAICEKATQLDRELRYATASDMQAALERALETLSTRTVSRDVGRIVSESFADMRAATKRIIEEQLAKTQHGEETPAVRHVPLLNFGNPAVSGAPGRRERRGPLWLGAGAGALALLVLGVTLVHGRSKTTEDAPAPSAASIAETAAPVQPPATESGGRPSAPAQVEISARAFPDSAVLYFDDTKLDGNPATIVRAPDATTHSIRAEAKGYLPRSIQIVVDKGADLVLTLEHAPSAGSRSAPHPTHTTEPHGAAPPDCNPPYYLDAQGIKKFKPGCI